MNDVLRIFVVIAGEVEVTLLTPLASVAHVNAGRMKAFGITSAERSPLLPAVPTIAELGVRGYDFQIWHGLFAPAGTPMRIVHDVHREAVRALNDATVRERFGNLGFVIVANTPEQFAAVIKREVERYRKIVAESGIQVE